MIALTVALAVLVGISLGMLGGGGSILTVPLLTYVAGLDAKEAITMSLLVVGVTSTIGAIPHARAGRVRWSVAAVFGVAAMSGAYTGGRLAHYVPGAVLLTAFAVIMFAAGISMLRGRREAGALEGRLPLLKVLALGAAVGVVSGLIGAGGGFLLVPALALFAGLSMPVAVGTSLAVIAVQSYAGLAAHLASEQIDWRLAVMVTGAAVAGALIGGRLVHLIDPAALREAFGWMVLAVGSLVLAEEVHPILGATTAGLTLAAAALTFACRRFARCPLRRLARWTALSPAATAG
jgi:uncharacterized membrane protein YfcA